MGGSQFSAASLYGATPQAPSYVAAPTQAMAAEHGAKGTDLRELVNIHNPLVWFGLVFFVTVGAASFAGSGRIGPVKVSGSVGES